MCTGVYARTFDDRELRGIKHQGSNFIGERIHVVVHRVCLLNHSYFILFFSSLSFRFHLDPLTTASIEIVRFFPI